ncbi:MAG: insulinase family protein [Planctomycetota bacterium]|nr:insulinase family protein [Planctomycetota bacterium]
MKHFSSSLESSNNSNRGSTEAQKGKGHFFAPSLSFLLLLVLLPAMVFGQTASTQPATGGELLESKAAMAGYGIESYRIVSAKDEIISVLRNGATIICKRVPSPVAAVRGYVYTGGVYEGKWLGGGLSHLLEHLVAGGSSERRTEAQNKSLLEKIGNDSNAYTTYDHTAYFVNTTTPHFADAADLVTGWMLGAKITPPEYRREYQVVQRELERNKGNPDMVFWQLMESNRYQVSPARVPVIGYQEVIQGLTRDDVYSYYQMAYQPNNMVFSVSANLNPEEMLSTMRHFLADAKPGRAFSRDIAQEPPVEAPRTVVATFPKLGQARLLLAFPSVKVTSNDMFAMDLLAQVLGGGESALLVEDIRDRQQLCTAIGCSDDTPAYADGSFEVDLQLDAANVGAATRAVLADLEKVKTDGVDADRLARAKAQMKINRLKAMQTSQDVAASLAMDYMTTGDAHFSDQYVVRIGEVTAEQVQAAAKKYLNRRRLLTTVLLPRESVGAKGLPKAEDLMRAAAPTTQAAPQSAAAITRTVLENGLIVLHRRITTTPLVQINMYALGGVTAEDQQSNGLGNIAMALLRRGTQTRSANDLSDFFDLTGGNIETVCGRNTWYWNVACAKDDFPRTMDVYADVINHPKFAQDQLDKMKARLQAAIAGQDAAWDGQAFRYFHQQFFGPMKSPYKFEAIGTSENVARFTPDDLKNWYTRKILTAPRVLAIFGDVDKDTAIAMATKYFGDQKLPAPPAVASAPAVADAPASTPSLDVKRVEIQKTDQEVAGVVIGFQSDSVVGESSQPVFTVAQCLTGGYGYPTGYIFTILRGRGLVYEAATANSVGRAGNLPGAFIAYAGCDPAKVNEVVNTILENIARLQGIPDDIQQDWFSRCKDMITTSEAMQTETPAEQALQAATEELFGMGFNYHEGFADRINAVEIPQVQQLARSRLRNCVVTICTPAPERVEIKPGERTYASFPTVDLTPRGVQHDVGAK